MDKINNIFRDDCDSSCISKPFDNSPDIYIFGYGSLIWNPGFAYTECLTGYVRGFKRKFWQGNVTHRGTEENPGRVVTLVKDDEGITWGCAYKVDANALKYLHERECKLGGYEVKYSKFFPRIASEFSGISGETLDIILYVATPKNIYWAGEDNIENIARQIARSSGNSGHNIEYLYRLASFMREEIPYAHDEHLFTLERLVKEIVIEKKICIQSIMDQQPSRIQRDFHENTRRNITFAHSSRAVEKKLRCLNI